MIFLKNKKKVLLIISIILFICVIVTHGITTFRDYMVLKNSDFFTDGPIGFTAQIPPTVYAKELQEKYNINRETTRAQGGCIIYTLDLYEIFEIDYFFIQWDISE